MRKPLLLMMMGHAGSGKSYFARQLAEREKIVRFNADAMRMAFFGSLESMLSDGIPKELRRMGGIYAVNYSVEQVLVAGHSVICDTNNNSHDARKVHQDLANKHNARAVVIWVQTSKELALQRAQEREELFDQRKFDYDIGLKTIERMIENTDDPASDEAVIKIDGTIPFEEQYEFFKKQFEDISS